MDWIILSAYALNNLAGLSLAQRRLTEAEPLYSTDAQKVLLLNQRIFSLVEGRTRPENQVCSRAEQETRVLRRGLGHHLSG
jgi:hypothetical protein